MITANQNKALALPRRNTQPARTGATRWDLQWFLKLELLKKFRKLNPSKWPDSRGVRGGNRTLAAWCQRQRKLYALKSLPPRRQLLLEKLYFKWEQEGTRDSSWMEQYDNLKRYRATYPRRWPIARDMFPRGNRLGLWAWRQRQKFKAQLLGKAKATLLRRIGFPLLLEDSWNVHYQHLIRFRAKNPDRWPKAREEFPKGRRLGLWCHLQRCAYKVKKLKLDRRNRLNAIEFPWRIRKKV